MYYGYGFGPGYGMFGLFMMLLFFAVIIAAVAILVRRPMFYRRMHDHEGHRSNALEILEERLARGEIDIEDYNTRKQALKREE